MVDTDKNHVIVDFIGNHKFFAFLRYIYDNIQSLFILLAETELKQILKIVLFATTLWYNQNIRKLWCLYLCAIKGGCGYG